MYIEKRIRGIFPMERRNVPVNSEPRQYEERVKRPNWLQYCCMERINMGLLNMKQLERQREASIWSRTTHLQSMWRLNVVVWKLNGNRQTRRHNAYSLHEAYMSSEKTYGSKYRALTFWRSPLYSLRTGEPIWLQGHQRANWILNEIKNQSLQHT